jgi:Glutathione S-transferase, N-terminal domain
MKLYDLAGAEDDLRFSPNCWRIKMALEHKGLVAETVPWRFVEKDVIAFSGQKAVPVLVDGDKSVSDSWEIARYLESGLFGSINSVWRTGGRRIGIVRKILV